MTTYNLNEDLLLEPATFELSTDITHVYNQLNPDGSNPTVTVKVETTALGFGLSVLQEITKNYSELLVDHISTQILEEETEIFPLIPENNSDSEELPAEFQEKFNDIMERLVLPFRNIVLDVNGVYKDKSEEATISFTGPSYAIIYDSTVTTITPQKIREIASSLISEKIDDEDND